VPYVFEPDENGDIRTIDNIPVKKVTFNSYKEYSEYTKDNYNCYENKSLPVIQFLAERYYNIPDEQIISPQLKIYSLDIEVIKETGGFNWKEFVEEAEDPIVLINIKEFGGPSISWGLDKYKGNYDLQYRYFNTEEKLLSNFLNWFNSNAPDVLTGFNIASELKMNRFGGFDLLYIINRCKYLFGEETKEYKKLSPIRQVTVRDTKKGSPLVDIAGISIIDYLPLYKWYSSKNLPNYQLETVCQEELKTGKIDHSKYGSFQDFYKQDPDLFIEYNAIDNQRIEDLETKLNYIDLVQQLSLLCKIPMKNYNATTAETEGLLLTHYRRTQKCAPKMIGGQQEWFPAAFVKEPKKGIHFWVSDLDITSSYPTAIIVLNMSTETYYGRILTKEKLSRMNLTKSTQYTQKDIIEALKNKKFVQPFYLKSNKNIQLIEGDKLKTFNNALQRGMLAVAPCGTCFLTKPEGVIAHIERLLFAKRKEVTRQKNLVGNKASEIEKQLVSDNNNPQLKKDLVTFKKEFNILNTKSLAIKVILNGVYGCQGVPYSRYFNVDIAEAIASCGRFSLMMGDLFANEILNKFDLLSLTIPGQNIQNIINEIKGL
jgi:DNA polymerase elongation subunit (family B)